MDEQLDGPPVVLGEETIYSGRILDLKRVQIRVPGGNVVQREIVDHHGSVGVLPITSEGNFLLVKQFRAPAGRALLELPAGTLEVGEPPEECAQRELAEEVGCRADSMRRVAGFYLAPGWATEFMHAYIATGLYPADGDGDEDEDIELVEMTPTEALKAIQAGDIVDCKSIAIIGLYFAELPSSSGAVSMAGTPARSRVEGDGL